MTDAEKLAAIEASLQDLIALLKYQNRTGLPDAAASAHTHALTKIAEILGVQTVFLADRADLVRAKAGLIVVRCKENKNRK